MLKERIANRNAAKPGPEPGSGPQPKPPTPSVAQAKPEAKEKPPRERATVTADCGHEVTFKVKAGSPLATQVAVARETKCGPCRNAEHTAAAQVAKAEREKGKEARRAKRLPWGYEVDVLPLGSVFTLTKVAEGQWSAELTAGGITLPSEAKGPRRQIAWLATEWARRVGILPPKTSAGTEPEPASEEPDA